MRLHLKRKSVAPAAETSHPLTFGPLNIANNILSRAFDEQVDVTPMKLQRLLYIAASEYAKSTGVPLLHEEFQAWAYGPAIRTVHRYFSVLGAGPIRKFAVDAAGKSSRVDETKCPELKADLDRAWNAAKHVSPVELSRLTQESSSAWAAAFSAQSALDHNMIAADVGYTEPLGLTR